VFYYCGGSKRVGILQTSEKKLLIAL